MAEAKQRRKFKCPNCDHMVRFEVDPESTLIACDHCGQLTRVTVKTSEPVESTKQKADSQESSNRGTGDPAVLSEAFDDLDLDGLDQGDYVRSSTIRKINVRGRSAERPAGGSDERSGKPQRDATQRGREKKVPSSGKSEAQASSGAAATSADDSPVTGHPEKGQVESQIGLGAPIPPPYVPTPPSPPASPRPSSQSPIAPPAGDLPPTAASSAQQQGNAFPVAPGPELAGLNQTGQDFFAVPPPPPSQDATPQAADSHPIYNSNVPWVGHTNPEEQTEILELDSHNLLNSDPTVVGSSDREEPMEILDELEVLHKDLPDKILPDSVRIVCRICNSLSYYPPADSYVCPDCYSRIDSEGKPLPKQAKNQSSTQKSSTEPSGDEIDDLISTAKDDNDRSGGDWQNEEATRLLNAAEYQDPVELAQNEGETDPSGDEEGELKLAPLDEPTEDYRRSIVPDGLAPDAVRSKPEDVHTQRSPDSGDRIAADPATTSVDDDLVELVDGELEDVAEVRDEGPGTASGDDQSNVNPTEDEFRLENQASVSSRSLFLDGSEVAERPEMPLASQQLAVPAQTNPPEPRSPITPAATGQIEEEGGETKTGSAHSATPPGVAGPAAGSGPSIPVPPPFPSDTTPPHNSPPQNSPPQSPPAENVSTTAKGPRTSQRSSPAATAQQSSTRIGQKGNPPATDGTDADVDPFADGWLGNWLPVVTSSWVMLGFLITSVGVAVLLSLGATASDQVAGTGWRVAALFGVLFFLPPTLAIWTWLLSLVIDGTTDKNPISSFDLNRYITHVTRFGFCALICLPGMMAGAVLGHPVIGTLVSLFYASPLALFWIVGCEYGNQRITLVEKEYAELAGRYRDLFMSAIAVLGGAAMIGIPFAILASFVPVPGLFLFAPVSVLFSLVVAIQIRRLVMSLRLLVSLESN